MQVLSDGGGIYTLGNQPESQLTSNTIENIPLNAGRAESNGMFLDEGTTGFTVQDNQSRRITRSPLRFHRAGKKTVRENRWELETEATPPVRYNNTPEQNITLHAEGRYLMHNLMRLAVDQVPSDAGFKIASENPKLKEYLDRLIFRYSLEQLEFPPADPSTRDTSQ